MPPARAQSRLNDNRLFNFPKMFYQRLVTREHSSARDRNLRLNKFPLQSALVIHPINRVASVILWPRQTGKIYFFVSHHRFIKIHFLVKNAQILHLYSAPERLLPKYFGTDDRGSIKITIELGNPQNSKQPNK